MQKKNKIKNEMIKFYMTKNPYKVEENTLATDVLNQMNKKRLLMFVSTKKTIRKKLSECYTFIILLKI